MVYQRPISTKIANSTKSGYQKIDLIGHRYILTSSKGTVLNYQSYVNTGKNDNQKELNRIQTIFDTNEFLSSFSGVLEILLNSFQFKIIDIMDHEDSKIYEDIYMKRLEVLRESIENENITTELNKASFVDTSVVIPTLYRSLDCSYKYGFDYIMHPLIKDSVYVIVGETIETKETKILIPRLGYYDNFNKVPKIVKSTFETLEEVNNWITEMYNTDDVVKVTKQNVEYIEFGNTEKTKVYLVAGKCPLTNKYKVFGKVKPTNKLAVIDTTPSENVIFDMYNDKLSASQNIYYKTGYVIACLKPKVSVKNLATISVLDVKQNVNLEESLDVVLDEIPTVFNQQAKKRIANTPIKILVEELSERFLQMPMYYEMGIKLQNVGDSDCMGTCCKRELESESDDEDEETSAKKYKMDN